MAKKTRESKLAALTVGAAVGVAAMLGGSEVTAQRVFQLAGAPYAAGVMAPAGATLAVLGAVAGEGADFASASADALRKMEARLAEVGLDRSHVLRVRAALAPANGDGAEFTAWSAAWTSFFSAGQAPARVTVGASALPGTARVVLDVVAAFPAALGSPARVAGARPTQNPNLRLAGPAANPIAVVSTAPGLFLSSGVLPTRNALADPESMAQQMGGSITALTTTLGDHGLEWRDAFFLRVLPTPQPDRAGVDFSGWESVYAELGARTPGQSAAYSMWAAPGFAASGRYSEIEVWAVPQTPFPAFAVPDPTLQNPRLKMTGGPGAIAAGAMIAPNAELVFLSGVVAPDGTAPADEGAAVLALLEERLAVMGASMADVAELRVYRLETEAGFNAAYGAHFNNAATNPHRPVRTNYLVPSLPAGRSVEVEAIVVRPR